MQRLLFYIVKSIQTNVMEISEKSWNQIQEYIWRWYPVLIGVESIEDKQEKACIT